MKINKLLSPYSLVKSIFCLFLVNIIFSNKVFSQNIIPQGESFLANTTTENTQEYSSIAMNQEGEFVVAWQSWRQDGDQNGIFAQKFDRNNTKIGAEIAVNVNALGHQRKPSVGIAQNGSFVIVWESYRYDGSGYGVYGQLFNAQAEKIGEEFLVNTLTEGDQALPKVAMNRSGAFVVVWEGFDNSGRGIFAQRYSREGVRQGVEFTVNSITENDQIDPSVAINGAGSFIVTWTSRGEIAFDYNIKAQFFSENGTKVGEEFQVNSNGETGNQSNSEVSMNERGSFIITWQGEDDNDDERDIYARLYSSDRSPISEQNKANTYIDERQENPVAWMDEGGNAVVVWNSETDGPAIAGKNIYARFYNKNGQPVGEEYQINTFTEVEQINPSVSGNSSNNFIASWDKNGSEDDEGIFVRKFTLDATVTSIDTRKELPFQIVPNPVKNKIRIITEGLNREIAFKIVALDGRVMEERKTNNLKEISIQNYSPGVYFIELTNDQKLLFIKKIVKL